MKRGLGNLVITLIIVLLALSLVSIGWVIVSKIMLKENFKSDVHSQILNTRIEFSSVNFQNISESKVVVKRLAGKLKLESSKYTSKSSEVDIITVVDLSGSMSWGDCENVTNNCCITNLGGDYNNGTCSKVASSKENTCINTCFGVWSNKLTPLKDASKNLVDTIDKSNNRIGISAYSNNIISGYSADLTEDTVLLDSKINSWTANGGTCICCGINNAVSRLSSQSTPEKPKAIIVMSDGDATVTCPVQGTGNPEQDAIKSAVTANSSLNTDNNFVIYSIGFGQDADEITLQAIANAGGGQYFKAISGSDLIEKYQSIEEEISQKYRPGERFGYVSIVFYNQTDMYEVTEDMPDVLQTKQYTFDLSEMGEITRVELYLVAIDDAGKEVTRSLIDFYDVKI